MRRSVIVLLALLFQCGVVAGEADVVEIEANCDAQSLCDLHVTVQGAGEGWEHYGGKTPVVAVHGSHGERSR